MHGRGQRESGIAGPDDAIGDRAHAAHDDRPRGLGIQTAGSDARRDGGIEVGEYAQAFVGRSGARRARTAEALQRAAAVVGQRPQRLDQHQPTHALGCGHGDQAGDRTTQRMPEQIEARQPQRIGRSQHGLDIVDEVVVRARRQMPRAAVSGQIQGDDMALPRQPRRQLREAAGVVQPAVQGQQRRQGGVAPSLRGEVQPRQFDHPLARAIRLNGHPASSWHASAQRPVPSQPPRCRSRAWPPASRRDGAGSGSPAQPLVPGCR